ncbi:MAG TPA: hypothetical protein VFA76_16845 [Terriglobales bacterium]|nr:hypothetical protein [Terriglobales bacterium]
MFPEISYESSRKATVLCADESSHRLFSFLHAALDGFSILLADSAAHCISLCGSYQPDMVLLSEGLMEVDQWSIPELLHLVSPKTTLMLTVEDPQEWRELPLFISVVVKRTDPESVISVLEKVRRERFMARNDANDLIAM